VSYCSTTATGKPPFAVQVNNNNNNVAANSDRHVNPYSGFRITAFGRRHAVKQIGSSLQLFVPGPKRHRASLNKVPDFWFSRSLSSVPRGSVVVRTLCYKAEGREFEIAEK
jgi:hypothetical protein